MQIGVSVVPSFAEATELTMAVTVKAWLVVSVVPSFAEATEGRETSCQPVERDWLRKTLRGPGCCGTRVAGPRARRLRRVRRRRGNDGMDFPRDPHPAFGHLLPLPRAKG